MGARAPSPTQGCGWVSWRGAGSPQAPGWEEAGAAGPAHGAPLPQGLSWARVPLPVPRRGMRQGRWLRPLCIRYVARGHRARPRRAAPGAAAPLSLDCEAIVAPARGCALPPSLSPCIPPSLPQASPGTSSLPELCHLAALKPSWGPGPGLPQAPCPGGSSAEGIERQNGFCMFSGMN